ncbi:ZIP family metal transporter [Candidatus Peregrinibacteria bacterium CG1_02_41_10]|nr:MAG: ZIP family metal transporter [Candidatus Peregrinibacteria bacterium CG1_02_41_10]
MSVWFATLVSVAVISLISLVGVLWLVLKRVFLERILLTLVSFAAGALLGDAFLHLLPEAVSEANSFDLRVSLSVLGGILFFFLLEKIVRWRHCHIPTSQGHPHPLVYMNLIGDGAHNLIDGLVIGGSYLVDFKLGLATTLAVIFHEIPQEIGDFGVLMYAGLNKTRALLLNFLTALLAIAGALIALMLGATSQGFINVIIPFTAGGFLYIATADLMPELHKECRGGKTVIHFLALVLGIGMMALLLIVE